MTTAPFTGLPFIATQQAQPEVAHNTALLMIQALLNGVKDKDLTAPPGAPADGDAYIVGAAATGAWTGFTNHLAIWFSNAWLFMPGFTTAGAVVAMGANQEGMTVWVRDEDVAYTWSGAAWAISSGIAIGGHAANSVIGRSANTIGNAADIVAGTNDRLFSQVANALGFTQLTAGMVPANTIALAGLVNATAQYNLMGRSTAAAGAWEQKATSADVFSMLGAANFAAINTLLGLGAAALLGVATDAQTRALTSSAVLVTPSNLKGRACFAADKNSVDQTGIASLTFTKVTFANETFDQGSFFASSAWTPPAGPIRVGANVRVAGSTASMSLRCSLYKNGVRFRDLAAVSTNPTDTTTPIIGGAVCDVANGTDVYEIYVLGITATTLTVEGATTGSYMSGEQV